MDDAVVKEALKQQIIDGDRHQVDLVRDKIMTLSQAGLVQFDFTMPFQSKH